MGFEDFYRELDDLAWGEVLAEVPLEEAIHELLEGDTLDVEIGGAEVDSLEVGDDRANRLVPDADRVGEDIGVAPLMLCVERSNAPSQAL